jgi:hypothetical protein
MPNGIEKIYGDQSLSITLTAFGEENGTFKLVEMCFRGVMIGEEYPILQGAIRDALQMSPKRIWIDGGLLYASPEGFACLTGASELFRTLGIKGGLVQPKLLSLAKNSPAAAAGGVNTPIPKATRKRDIFGWLEHRWVKLIGLASILAFGAQYVNHLLGQSERLPAAQHEPAAKGIDPGKGPAAMPETIRIDVKVSFPREFTPDQQAAAKASIADALRSGWPNTDLKIQMSGSEGGDSR